MTSKISPREWEDLSAYLDGQLNPKRRARLEAGLQESEELRAALEELRRTRILLRSQPKLRAPRNFTLTPEMAGLRRSGRMVSGAYPVLRLASVLAAIFFVMLFAGDLLFGLSQPEAVSMVAAPQDEISLPAPAFAPGVGSGAGEDQGVGGGAGDAQTQDAGGHEPTEVAVGEVAEKAVEAAREAPAAQGEQMGLVTLEAEADLTAEESYDGAQLVTPMGPQAIAPLTVTSEPELSNAYPEPGAPAPAEEALKESDWEAYPSPAPVGGTSASVSLLRLAQVLLAVLAVTAGLAALYLRRSAL